MARIESSIHVASSVESVFAFLSEAENHARFIPNMVEFMKTSPGPFARVGATVAGVLGLAGLRMKVYYEIIEHEQDHRLAMRGLLGPIAFKDGYVLRPAGSGTNVDFWLELTTNGWRVLISPFAVLIGRIHAWETLRNLKRELGNTAPSANI